MLTLGQGFREGAVALPAAPSTGLQVTCGLCMFAHSSVARTSGYVAAASLQSGCHPLAPRAMLGPSAEQEEPFPQGTDLVAELTSVACSLGPYWAENFLYRCSFSLPCCPVRFVFSSFLQVIT